MYDNINWILDKNHTPDNDFLSEVTPLLERMRKIISSEDEVYYTGYIENLKIFVSKNCVKFYGNSLPKYFFGNNFDTMTRINVKDAFERISDTISLPLDKARITRIDVAHNMAMKYIPTIYLPNLGTCRHYERLPNESSLYYRNKKRQLIFYDKNQEAKDKKFPIPILYQNSNYLRYEIRFEHRINKQLGKNEITVGNLYEENFYNKLNHVWFDNYENIYKIKKINLDYTMVKTTKQRLAHALLKDIQSGGGLVEELNRITQAQKQGILKPYEACRLRKLASDACKNTLFTTENELITELDSQIKQAWKYNQ
ncbi:MAG: hypothetical protein NT007_14935 [Candidatus Kapabacteria bacterium]|nr:hypothetical protein [Candidatus Kapabacteria bacterium]